MYWFWGVDVYRVLGVCGLRVLGCKDVVMTSVFLFSVED